MQLDKRSHLPLYRQVESLLEEKIKSGEWSVGFQLPTEQELAVRFNVSTITVKRAILELVNKGYLFRQRGKGTYISGTPKEQDINSFISFTNEIETETQPHQLISFSIQEVNEEISEKLKLANDSLVVQIERLKIEGNEPMALEYTYLPYSICPDLSAKEIENDLIYHVLKTKYQIPLGRAKLFIKPYIVEEGKAELLQIQPGTPVFEWERVTYTKSEEVVEYSKFYVRPDKEAYYTEVHF